MVDTNELLRLNRVACIIPTRNGGKDLRALLPGLARQQQPFDLFVIDSSSSDDTCTQALALGAEVVQISATEFDHGGTRQRMVDMLKEYEIYLFLTQDAEPGDELSFRRLVEAFDDPTVGAAYGRQLPKPGATPFAAFLREFNYPPCSRRQSLYSVSSLGMKTAFISNSFSAYRRDALKAVGGFPRKTILGEDIHTAARLIQACWVIDYVAEAKCFHSHNYSVIQEWRRYFDIGVFYKREAWIHKYFGGVGGEGKRFVIEELRYLSKANKRLWPISLLRNAGKLASYKLGQNDRYLPIWLKKKLSMHSRFWDSTT